MNIASYARGLLTELEGSVRLGRDNEDDIRAELRRVAAEARKVAMTEQAALEKGDPVAPTYDKLLADLDDFAKADKPGKQTATAAAAPHKA